MNQKYRSKQNNTEEISYWESMTDLMSSLMLIVLAIFALVLLYIVRIPDEDYKDLYAGDTYTVIHEDYRSNDPDGYGDGYGHDDYDDYDDYEHYASGGGGDGYDEKGDSEFKYEFPGIVDDIGKAAVRVTVVDAETENVIRKPGTEFQLFRAGDYLQVLCTYYPDRKEYSSYLTRSDGTFFLPEKIPGGSYYLSNLNAPEGYEPAESVEFTISVAFDWAVPYELTVPMYPCRNLIRIRMTDLSDGTPIAGGEFDIVAAENIVTSDGTLRNKRDEIVDHIVCDEDGRAESIPLFLGTYDVKPTRIPEFYAASDSTSLRLYRRNDAKDKDLSLLCEKTGVTYRVVDELDGVSPLSGASFEVMPRGSSSPQRYTTDSDGCIRLTNLAKNQTYIVRQIASPDGYRYQASEYTFTVSAQGTVEDAPTAVYEITNRTCRVRIGVQDALLHHPVSDYSVALYTADDRLIRRWDSSGIAESIQGLEPGLYKLVLRGDAAHARMIEVHDTCEVQNFHVSVWTLSGILTIVFAAAGIAAVTVFMILRKKKSKQVLTDEQQS